jgi:hypothetical protein
LQYGSPGRDASAQTIRALGKHATAAPLAIRTPPNVGSHAREIVGMDPAEGRALIED